MTKPAQWGALVITSPANGATVSGTITVAANYSGPGFKSAALAVNGVTVGSPDTTQPISFTLDTTALADGARTLMVSVDYLFSKNQTRTEKASVMVTVANNAPPPPQPPPPNYPASYFTGPLGSTNILPAVYGGALLIMWCDTSGDTGIAASNRALVQQRMTDCGRTFDGVGIHYAGDETPGTSPGSLGSGGEAWVHGLGSVPIVTWSPAATVAQINSGAFDATYRAAATYFKSLGYRVMLRMMWEFDGSWFPWRATTGSEAAWIAAWRRIVGLFQAAGASNVGFWWGDANQNRTLADACYPGDAYVDWVGPDRYNWDDAGWQTPFHAGWAEFDEIFNYGSVGGNTSAYNVWSPRKPYVVGEFSSKYDTSGVPAGHSPDANRKANLWKNIALVAKPKMPLLCGVQIVDQWLIAPENNDWRVDSNQPSGTASKGSVDATTYTGFKAFAADPAFNVGV